MGSISSAPSSLNAGIIKAMLTRVEYLALYPNATDYSSGTWKEIPGAIVSNMTLRIGPEPSDCLVKIPIDISQSIGKNWEQGRAYTHRVMEARHNRSELAAFGPLMNEIKLWTKIRIFQKPSEEAFTSYMSAADIRLPRIFIGYVTSFVYSQQGTDYTEMILTCKDGRELLRKTPVSGVLFYNPEDTKADGSAGATVFIRDHPIIFNEGGKSNRYHNYADGQWTGDSSDKPRFIRVDYNRFVDDPSHALGDDLDHMYAPDAFLEHAEYHRYIPNPHARKWYAGHVWNYIRNLIDSTVMKGGSKIYDDPETVPNDGELPIMRDQEVYIPLVYYDEGGNGMYNELFVPRAIVGAVFQTGAGDAVSGLGEYNPTGLPVNEVLFEILRKVGNYTLAPSYGGDDKLILRPIRTTLAYTEQDDAMVGNRGRSGGALGKRLTIILPGDDDTVAPNVYSATIQTSSDNYYNRMRMGGGPHIAQVTFTTVALSRWTDQNGQQHFEYGPKVPAGEWLPRTTYPTLVPGWSNADQILWLEAFEEFDNPSAGSTTAADMEKYPDVFRTWVVPQSDGPTGSGIEKINWAAFLGKAADTPGFRRFFDRDREALNALITKVYDVTLGIFRRRGYNLPFTVARAYRGIRMDSNGATAYGDATTEAPGADNSGLLRGYGDWYHIQSGVDVLTDGRLGIRFGPDARLGLHDFERPESQREDGGLKTKKPMVWNFLRQGQGPKSFEILWTIPIILDEYLWEQVDIPNAGADGSYTDKAITRYGPAMEYYVNNMNEFVWEEAIHSLAMRPNPSDLANMIPLPPVAADGISDASTRIYTDPTEEMRGRLRMMANRNMVIDQIADLTLPYIDLSIQPGDYIRDIKLAGAKSSTQLDTIRINAICSSVTHDFALQHTLLRLETIK